jgi:hypothetical protein
MDGWIERKREGQTHLYDHWQKSYEGLYFHAHLSNH